MKSEEEVRERGRLILSAIPHCEELGMVMLEASDAGVVIELPYNEELEANPRSGIMHSGAITTLLDTACGMSTYTRLKEFEPCPTLDLRIDHLGLPEPFKPVRAFAEVYRVTRSVMFTRGIAYQTDRDNPFIHAVGTFMRRGPSAIWEKGQSS
ncbi:MAG: PaaI family thioesterase [Endozoicomonas sp.]